MFTHMDTGGGVSEVVARSLGWEVVTDHGARGDFVTDNTAAIRAAISEAGAGGVVYFPQGNYLILGDIEAGYGISLAANSCTLRGTGPGTWLLIPRASDRASLPNGFISVSAQTDPQIVDLNIAGASGDATTTCVADAIQIVGSSAIVQRAVVRNVRVYHCNGYLVNSLPISGGTNTPITLADIEGAGCANGVHLQGSPTAPSTTALLSNIYFANHIAGDGLFLEDVADVAATNVTGEILSGAGACLHVKGVAADIQLTNCQMSASGQSGSHAALIEKSANGIPRDIFWQGGIALAGENGITVTDLNGALRLTNVNITNSTISGLVLPNTGTISGATVIVTGCQFISNNAGAAGGYDCDFNTGTNAVIYLTNVMFSSTSITKSVRCQQQPNLVYMSGCVNNSGKSAANFFGTAPARCTRDCQGLNPWGAWQPSPSFTSGVGKANYLGADSMVYLLSGSVTAATLQGVNGTVTLPLSGPWEWPAGSILLLTFTSATFATVGR